MITIQKITQPAEKESTCNEILRALPDWFGVEDSIVAYVKQVQRLPFWAAFADSKAIGFAALKTHNAFTAEICVMGIQTMYQRQGIGRKLLDCCETHCREYGMEFLTVKTLDESRECENYRATRQFYLLAGFKPLEVFPLFWDKENPCLFLAKYIG